MFQSLELLKEKKRIFLGGPRGMPPPPPRKILKVKTKICAIWGILEANLKKSSTLMFMMNISFVPSICIHRSIIFILIEKKISTHFLTSVKNSKFSLSPTVCVCVCVERERERTVSLPRPAYPKIHLSVLQAVCVRIFRFMIGLFSLFCFLFVWFLFLFFCGCTTNQDKKKVSNDNFRQTCSISLWTPTPVSNVIPIVFSIPNSISAILNICWSFTSEFEGLRTKFIRVCLH